MIDQGIYQVLKNEFLDRKERIRLSILAFQEELGKEFRGQKISEDLKYAIKSELLIFSQTLSNILRADVDLKPELIVEYNRMIVNYINLSEFLAQF